MENRRDELVRDVVGRERIGWMNSTQHEDEVHVQQESTN